MTDIYTNKVELIKILASGNKYPRYLYDEDQFFKAYTQLLFEESKEIANFAIETKNEYILENLAVYQPHSLLDIQDTILQKEITSVGIVFKNASDEICQKVIKRIENTSSERSQVELLIILAWIGTVKAQEKLKEYTYKPIVYWQSNLYTGYFTRFAGWEFDKSGNRRDLYFNDCYPFYTKDVRNANFSGESCPWCSRPLLFAYDIQNFVDYCPKYKSDEKSFRILTCSHCTHYSNLFSEVNKTRKCTWSFHNKRPLHMKSTDGNFGEYYEYTPDITIEKYKINPFSFEAWIPRPIHPNGKIGGLPSWVQEPDFPICPSCNKTMTYIAQYDISWVVYAFHCFDCSINATNIQTD